MDVQALVAAAIALVAGVFGREFVGRWLLSRQEAQRAADVARYDRETSVIKSLFDLTQSNSEAQIELTNNALTALREMTVHMNRLTEAVLDHERQTGGRMEGVGQATELMLKRLEQMDVTFSERSDRIEAHILTLAQAVMKPDKNNRASSSGG